MTDRPAPEQSELSKLGLRVLAVLAGGPGDGEAPSGAAVRHRLANEYGSGVSESRVYQLLGDLVDRGLVEKGRVVGGDARAKRFAVTDRGRTALRAEVTWLADRTPGLSLADRGSAAGVRSRGDD